MKVKLWCSVGKIYADVAAVYFTRGCTFRLALLSYACLLVVGDSVQCLTVCVF